MQSDLLVWIAPTPLDPPAGLVREGGRGVRGVFDAVFSDSDVALAKEPGLTAQVHGLILRAHQRHFDALLRRLPVGPIHPSRALGGAANHRYHQLVDAAESLERFRHGAGAVSYTHLTLPTILLV